MQWGNRLRMRGKKGKSGQSSLRLSGPITSHFNRQMSFDDCGLLLLNSPSPVLDHSLTPRFGLWRQRESLQLPVLGIGARQLQFWFQLMGQQKMTLRQPF